MKNRIISFIVLLSMILSMSSFTAFGAEESTVYAPYVDSMTLLNSMGIIEDNLDPAGNITRGQAAKCIVNMLNERSNIEAYRGVFKDVYSETVNACDIEKLCDLGIVKGDGNYRYRPDDNLTYNEAMWIFINVLGYGVREDINSVIYQIAQTEGITRNIKREYEVVNNGDFSVMLYNTLMAHPFMKDDWGSDKDYYFISDQTLLYHIFKITYQKGILVKNDLTYLWSSEVADNDTIEIQLKDGSRLKVDAEDMTKAREDIGKDVVVYYKHDELMDENVYICHTVTDNNKSIVIPLEWIDSATSNFDNYVINYYEELNDPDEKTVKLADDYNIIYNNVAYKSHKIDFDSLENKVGNIEFIDNDKDNYYEIVKVEVFDTLVVDRKSTDFNFITDKFNTDRKVDIDIENYKAFDVYDKDGKEITVNDILSGSVISVAKSDALKTTDNAIEIYVSDRHENGKITDSETGETPKFIVLDYENKYNVYDRAVKSKYTLNKNVVAYFDIFGNIIYLKDDVELGMNYGIITRVKPGKAGIDDEIKVRYINGSGRIIETKLATNVVIDGESYKKKLNQADERILNGALGSSNDIKIADGIIPVRYKTDEDGNLTMIDTINSDKKNSDDVFSSTGAGKYGVYGQYIFGKDIPFSTDATVIQFFANDFTDLSEYEDENHIKLSVASSVFKSGNKDRYVLTFKTDDESIYSDFIINLCDDAIDFDTPLFVIDSIVEAYNEATDSVMTMLKGYQKGVYTEVFAGSNTEKYEDLIKLKKGDMIRYLSNVENCITKYNPIFVKNSDGTVTLTNPTSHSYNKSSPSSVWFVYGYVYQKQGFIVQVGDQASGTFTPDIEAVDWEETEKSFVGIPESVPVLVVKTNKDNGVTKIQKGSIDSILDYKTFGNEASMVALRIRSGTLQEIIVFNNK